MSWTVDDHRSGRHDSNVVVVRGEVSQPIDAWSMSLYCMSDLHLDNPKCKRRLLKQHLDAAAATNSPVVLLGDTFDAMQGKRDKRSDKGAVDPEIARRIIDDNRPYHDALVDWVADFLEPYAHLIIGFGLGNHETTVRAKDEIDYTGNLVKALRARGFEHARDIGYSGFLRLQFTRGKQRQSWTARFFHGSGGGGPVTKDIIQMSRWLERTSGIDAFMYGHTHDLWIVPTIRHELNSANRIERRTTWGLKCGTYKDDLGKGVSGFAAEQNHPPKPLGSIRVDFTWKNPRIVATPHILQ